MIVYQNSIDWTGILRKSLYAEGVVRINTLNVMIRGNINSGRYLLVLIARFSVRCFESAILILLM